MKVQRRGSNKYRHLLSLSILLTFVVALLIFIVLAHEVANNREAWFDNYAFDLTKDIFGKPVISLFRAITFLGSSTFLLPAYIALIVLLHLRDRKNDAIEVLLIGILSTALLHILKAFFGRKRPDLPLFEELTNYSFPSGHALSSFVLMIVGVSLILSSGLCRTWKIAWTIFLFILSISIGISRVILRYHYASDVVAGFCVAIVFMILFFWFRNFLSRN